MNLLTKIGFSLCLATLSLVSHADDFFMSPPEGPDEVVPNTTHKVSVFINRGDTEGAAEILLSLKNPAANWDTYARARTPVTQVSGCCDEAIITITVDADAAACSDCVWEARALRAIGDPDEASFSQKTSSVAVITEDKIKGPVTTLNLTPGENRELTVRYIASEARTIRVELVSSQEGVYSGVIQDVPAGTGFHYPTLPVSPNLKKDESTYVSVKITPVGAHWSEYIDEINYPVSLNIQSDIDDYFWKIPVAFIPSATTSQGVPTATQYTAKIGLLNSVVPEELPMSASEGLGVSGTAQCCTNGYAMDFITGEIIRYWSMCCTEKTPPFEGDQSDFNSGNYSFVYQSFFYIEGGDNTDYIEAIYGARAQLESTVSGNALNQPQFQAAIDFLDAVLAEIP